MDDVTSSSSSPSVSVPEKEQKRIATGDEFGDVGGADGGGACYGGLGVGLVDGGDSFDVDEDAGDVDSRADEGGSEELLQFDLPSIVSMDDVLIALRDCSLSSGASSGENLR